MPALPARTCRGSRLRKICTTTQRYILIFLRNRPCIGFVNCPRENGVPEKGMFTTGPMAIGFAIDPALALLKRAGIETRPLLARSGLSEEHSGDASLRRVPAAAQARFLELAAEALGDSALGLHLAAAGDPRTVGLVFYVGAAAKTLGDAMELMTRYVSIADECAHLNLAPHPTASRSNTSSSASRAIS